MRCTRAMTPELPSGRVTFVFLDVVGSTRLFSQHRDQFVVALGALHAAVDRHAAQGDGVVVKTEGDGAFLAFGSAESAVDAMVMLQDELQVGELFAGLPWLHVRVGAHTGSATPVDGDYVAYAVNVAARVSAAACSGQVLVSQAVADDLSEAARATAVELGAFALKDLEEPIVLWRVRGDVSRPRAAPARRTNVDEPYTSFIGRDHDLTALSDAVAEHRLVSVVGTGGLGKTRLVSQFALACCESFEYGVWLAELATITSPEALPGVVGAAVGLEVVDDLSTVVADLRRRGELVLVLDNCEHLLDDVAHAVTRLLTECPHLRVVCTSREPLLLEREQVLRPTPLGTEAAGPAEELFVNRAARNGVHVRPDEREIARTICELFDGLPLAIELAAAQSDVLSLPELASALAERRIELRRRGVEDRQANLDNLVRWSLQLLSPRSSTPYSR